jgi:hypothetical protein
MQKRYLYSILFGIPGCIIGLLIAGLATGAVAGALWLYVFGDDPWPHGTTRVLPILFVTVFLLVWLGAIVAGYRAGRRLEAVPGLDRRHLLISAGATALPLLLVALHQLRVGNLGPVSDSVWCSDFCRARGYTGSGMPPRDSGDRTCTCYDSRGRAALQHLPEDGASD